MEFTLLWAALTAFVFAWAGTRIWSERLVDRPTDRLIGAASVGLLLGRLTAMILQGTNPFSHLGDILIVRAEKYSLAPVPDSRWPARSDLCRSR